VSDAAGVDRIAGLDLARGLAVLGMFGAHLDIGTELTSDPSSWSAVVDGRSSILFATLAGVSMALLSGRSVPADGIELVRARLRIAVRAAWVFAIGAVLEWLDTFVAIILGVYAVLFVLALPFLRWPPRRLLVAAGVIAVAGPPLNALLGQVLSVADAESHYVAELLVTGAYPAMLWLAFVLVGLAVGRLDLAAAGVRARLAGAGAAAAVLGYAGGWTSTRALADGVPSSGPEEGFASPVGEWRGAWFTGAEPHSGTTFELVGSGGFAVLVIAGCLVVADRLPLLTAPLRAVGALALSVYTAQIVVLWALLQVDPAAAEGVVVWLMFVLSALAGAGLWWWKLGRGPLERLLTWSSTRAAAVDPARQT
jgi:uncharacterized membrane protein YeiB